LINLQSNKLKISINTKGAELFSVKNNQGLEFIWQADNNIWPRHAPVLFPIVGKLKENKFLHEGVEYQLPQHGFARDTEFEIIHQTKTECVFQLQSNDESRKNFPFDFVFQITFTLEENILQTKYSVKNSGDSPILFSVGAHPGFNCPLLPNENFEDYYLAFETEKLTLTTLDGGLRKSAKKVIHLQNKQLPITKTLFDQDALVLEDQQINEVTLASKKNKHSIKLNCQNWPYFGIWSKKSCEKFICLEPWHGIADNISGNKNLSKKDGILHLASKKEFNCSFSCTFV
jgi:galactose mutarotase-like enzyme